jgi:Uma2 family endonuclease
MIMATVGTRLMTAEEFWDWWGKQADDENDCRYELHSGRVVRFAPGGLRHGIVCANAGALFFPRAAQHGGFASSNHPCLLVGRNPDTVLGPDLLFFDFTFPHDEVKNSYWTRLPAVAIEVIDTEDTWASLSWRVSQLLQAGVSWVWVIDPESETVSAFRPDQPHCVLEGDDILPVVELPASRCFHLY